MKISDLISELADIMRRRGDLPVYCKVECGCGASNDDSVSIIEDYKSHVMLE